MERIIVQDEIRQLTYFIFWMRFDPFHLLNDCITSLTTIYIDWLGDPLASEKTT